MRYFWIVLILFISASCHSQVDEKKSPRFIRPDEIKTGAERTELYFNLLKNKKIAIAANQTSTIRDLHLVDSLLNAGFSIVKVFGPEHGFRGTAEAGQEIQNGLDLRTGLPVISLYGNHKKPSAEDLKGIDIVIYDIQDVGVRFFTYISTMTYIMESCAEHNIPMIILDRPNPNGFYVDGPVLDTAFSSFAGLHPVPIVYGMTAGEYALMVNGEGWLKNHMKCGLEVVPVKGYNHSMIVRLPIKPSPNLPNWQSVYLYPSLCLFEGTIVSVGRGTEYPFQVIGHPLMQHGSLAFKPASIPGIAENPPLMGQQCYGQSLNGYAENILNNKHHFTLAYLISYYKDLKNEADFFNGYFDLLAGGSLLRSQIQSGLSEDEIRMSWEKELQSFLMIRKKYLLYDDFK